MAQSGRLGMTDAQKGELWQRWRKTAYFIIVDHIAQPD